MMSRKLLLLCLVLFFSAAAAQAVVYYVDGSRPNNIGNGLNWGAAKKDVQNAMNAAGNGDEVWVKAGTYMPTEDPNGNAAPLPYDKTFYITTKDIRLYGGFAGTETVLSQRNATINVTVLSGDLTGAGVAVVDAYHVLVTLGRSSACVVDGFTITEGDASGSDFFYVTNPGDGIPNYLGGGMYNSGSSPTVRSCTFTANSAYGFGGGMYNAGSSPTVSSCTFTANSTTGPSSGFVGAGGGMYNIGGSPTVSSCTFTANTATSTGGGMYNEGSSPSVSSCIFSANSAINEGGGMCNIECNPAVSSCTFTANIASTSHGGGMYNYGSSPAVSACTFTANTASSSGAGGGMCNWANSNPAVSVCTFSANTANGGGGIGNVENSSPTVRSCTFFANHATFGGGVYYNYNSGGSITNCILYGNNGGQANQQNIFRGGAITPLTPLTLSYSLIGDYNAGATNNYTSGAGILNSDPFFTNGANPAGADGALGTADDGLTLRSCSPAVNSGTTTSPAVATDLLNNSRVGAYDLGAYEYQEAATISVLANATSAATRMAYFGGETGFGDCNATIARLRSAGSQPVIGNVTAQVYVQTTTPTSGQNPYVRRYYDIMPANNPNTATAQLTLYFTQADFDSYNTVRGSLPPLPLDAADVAGNKANVQITQEHGTSATGAPGSYAGWGGAGPATVLITPTSVIWNATATRWEVTFPVTGFSGFFVHSGLITPLPAKLIAFEAKRIHSFLNIVKWETATEEPGTLFTVERSSDAKVFEPIEIVTGRGAPEGSYQLEDAAPLTGDNYYRLRITELGSAVWYSNTVLVKKEGADASVAITVLPNPAIDKICIRCTNKAYWGKAAMITSVDGRVMKQIALGAAVDLDVERWAAGIYLLRLPDGTAIRVVKN